MILRHSTYFRFLAFLTLVFCAPMNVLAAGPYVWCMGPHDHAVIESNATEAHHGAHHDEINSSVPPSHTSHQTDENSTDCIDLALGQDGQLSSIDTPLLVPDLIELPRHLSSLFAPSSCSRPLTFGLHGPPETGAFRAQSMIIQHSVILLI